MSVWRSCPESWLGHRGPVLFLDRDGVVIADRDYLGDPREVQVLPGVAATMLAAREAGFAVVGVSNQSGLGRGFFTPADFSAVMERLDELLARQGAEFDGFYYCPHAPQEDCDCRKPKGGLLAEAARRLTWNPDHSWVVGDKVSDLALGRDHDLGAVLVRTGYGKQAEGEVRDRWSADPRVLVADDLPSAWLKIQAAGEVGR
jgi:histidinol-phosphate phosphatase family protein